MKYFVESYGCTMNFGEGDSLSDKLSYLGHIRTDNPDDADLVILNTCIVVDTTEKKMLQRMSELRKSGKEVVVTGCMAKVHPKRISLRLPDSIIVPPGNYSDFESLIADKYECCSPIVQPINEKTAIIPIAQGCLGRCTYCITKLARGNLISFDQDLLISRFKTLVEGGVKEILLAAQDTASYGVDIGSDLPTLIRGMLTVEGDYRIRVGMMNPDRLIKILDGMMDVMEDPRVYRFFHIPVQSGSDSVLKAMNRHYTVDEFRKLVFDARSRYPDISIATDIISGFPGETDDDHLQTISLIKELRCDTINITRFSARPGTPAFDMDQVHGRIIKERSTELTTLKFETEFDVNKELVGSDFEVLVTEAGKLGTVISRNRNYRPIIISEDYPLGTFLNVTVDSCESTHLFGKVRSS